MNNDNMITDEEFALADEILDLLAKNPTEALKLYVKASPRVKKMLGRDPREYLIKTNPKINDSLIRAYTKAFDEKDQVGMLRIYKSANNETKKEIDRIFFSK